MQDMNGSIIKSSDIFINTPFRMTCSAPTSSGKTHWIRRFVKYHEDIVGHKFDTIIYMYGQYQKLYEDMKEQMSSIIWCEGFSPDVIETNFIKHDASKLLIVDDLVSEVSRDKYFHSLYIKKSHHMNISIIFTTQYLHYDGLRLINLNTSHYILFRSLRDSSPVRCLAMQMFPTKWRKFMDIYLHATR